MNNIATKKEWLLTPFTQFPAFIEKMKEVSQNDKAVLRALFNFIRHKGEGKCYPKQATIAKEAGVSTRAVIRGLARWEKLRFIKKDYLRDEHRTYYYLLSIPPDMLIKYGENPMELEKRKLEAQRVMDASKERMLKNREEKLEKARTQLSDSVFVKEEKVKAPRDTRVYNAAKLYTEVFMKKFPGSSGVMITQKETGQLKTFIEAYDEDVLKGLILELFSKWDYYKVKWKIESDYPTIGIIVTYGKGKVISYNQEVVNAIPEKDETGKPMIELPGMGW